MSSAATGAPAVLHCRSPRGTWALCVGRGGGTVKRAAVAAASRGLPKGGGGARTCGHKAAKHRREMHKCEVARKHRLPYRQ